MSNFQETTEPPAPKAAKAPKPAKQPPTIEEQPTVKSNDTFWHIPFILVIIIGAVAATQLINTGLSKNSDADRLEKLEQRFDGYQDGVKDVN